MNRSPELPEPESTRTAVASFGLALVAVVVTFAAGIAPLYGQGLSFSTGWLGAALHLPLIGALLGVSHAILVRRMGRTREEEGLAIPRFGEAGRYLAGALAGLAVAALLAVGSPTAAAVRAEVRIAAWLAFGLSAWLQLIALHLLGSTLRLRFGPLVAGVVTSAVFTAFHVEHSTPVWALVTTFAFGGLDLLLVRADAERASWAAAVGFHGGWNSALALFLGSPLSGTPTPWQSPDWPADLGGAYGLEGSLRAAVTLVGLAWLFGAIRRGPGMAASIDVCASPARTRAFLADLTKETWREGIGETWALGNSTNRGGRWSRHVEVDGRVVDPEASALEHDAPRVLVIRRASGPANLLARYVLSPTADGTRIDFSLQMPLRGAWRLSWPLATMFFELFVRPAARRDFVRLRVQLGSPPAR